MTIFSLASDANLVNLIVWHRCREEPCLYWSLWMSGVEWNPTSWWRPSGLCSAAGVTTSGLSCSADFPHRLCRLNYLIAQTAASVICFWPIVPQFLATVQMFLISVKHSQLFNSQRLVNLFTCNSDQLCFCIYLKERAFAICMCPLIVFLCLVILQNNIFYTQPTLFLSLQHEFSKLNLLPVKINTRHHWDLESLLPGITLLPHEEEQGSISWDFIKASHFC